MIDGACSGEDGFFGEGVIATGPVDTVFLSRPPGDQARGFKDVDHVINAPFPRS